MVKNRNEIRNFSIIAHVDHGKSTLADCFIRNCKGLSTREMREQVLDSMDIERERGITIKAQAVTLNYQAQNGQRYKLNLIDTPGHVDFSYEVSRSLAACEGSLLVVDATQGVEAQTVAVCQKAVDLGLDIIPVLNKIDLPHADCERVKKQIEDVIGIDARNSLEISAKNNLGVNEVLEYIVNTFSSPQGDSKKRLKGLIIDSWFDNYQGVTSLICIKEGRLELKDKITFMQTEKIYQVEMIGIFTPKISPCETLLAGEVGFFTANIKDIADVRVGDTITTTKRPASRPLAGFSRAKPQVYAGIFPIDSNDYQILREALKKLRLNDASLFIENENSQALGFGFRCGFLGMLHMEIIMERLKREYNLNLILTVPTVIYEVIDKKGEKILIDNPAELPERNRIVQINEPIAWVKILLPQEYVGAVMKLCIDKRGILEKTNYYDLQVELSYEIPMSEIIIDFFDRLKSITRGFASFDYEFKTFCAADLIKLDILINGDLIDSLSTIVHKGIAYKRGKSICEKMQKIVPRQMFEVAIQAAIGGKIITRSSVKPLRKNVTAKCYGGDVTRKMKLLEKQKEGKKKMKRLGRVDIPKEAFLSILKTEK